MLWGKLLLYYLIGQTSLATNTSDLNSTTDAQNIMRVGLPPSNFILQLSLDEVPVSRRRKREDTKASGTDNIDVRTYKTYFSAFAVRHIKVHVPSPPYSKFWSELFRFVSASIIFC